MPTIKTYIKGAPFYIASAYRKLAQSPNNLPLGREQQRLDGRPEGAENYS
jgi:hypothetical protein